MSSTKKKNAPKGVKGIRVTKEFEFDLTNEEFAERGKQAAALAGEVLSLELEFEEVKETWKAKIKSREAKRDDLLAAIRAKKEKRTVEATMVKDFDSKEIQYWVGGAIVERRTMTAEELQQDLPLDAKRGEKARAVRQKIQKADAGEKAGQPDPVQEAHAKGNGKFSDIGEVHQLESRRATKSSAVDGPTKN